MRPFPYVRCPGCGLVAPPDRLEYSLGVLGAIDWGQPVRWQCAECGFQDHLTADRVLTDDCEHLCAGCGTRISCPCSAARVECRACGLIGLGPATANPEVSGHLRAVEGLRAIELRVRQALNTTSKPPSTED